MVKKKKLPKPTNRSSHRSSYYYTALAGTIFILLLIVYSWSDEQRDWNKTVVLLDDEVISLKDYYLGLEGLKQDKDQNENLIADKRRTAAEMMKNMVEARVLAQIASRFPIPVHPKEVVDTISETSALNDDKKRFSEEKFSQLLQYTNTSEAKVTEDIERQVRTRKFLDLVKRSILPPKKLSSLISQANGLKYKVRFLEIDPKVINVDLGPDDIDQYKTSHQTELKNYVNQRRYEYRQPARFVPDYIYLYCGQTDAWVKAQQSHSCESAEFQLNAVAGRIRSGSLDFDRARNLYSEDPFSNARQWRLSLTSEQIKDTPFAELLEQPEEMSGILSTTSTGVYLLRSLQSAPEFLPTEPEIERFVITTFTKETAQREHAKNWATEISAALSAKKKPLLDMKDVKLSWHQTNWFSTNGGPIPGIGGDGNLIRSVQKLSRIGETTTPVEHGGKVYLVQLLDWQTQPRDADEEIVATYETGQELQATMAAAVVEHLKHTRLQYLKKNRLYTVAY